MDGRALSDSPYLSWGGGPRATDLHEPGHASRAHVQRERSGKMEKNGQGHHPTVGSFSTGDRMRPGAACAHRESPVARKRSLIVIESGIAGGWMSPLGAPPGGATTKRSPISPIPVIKP
ncbi:hypothetical protein CMUS01_13366 [Colletotrichum musicola]|uniref:Uncharacterized protein n=1 Tax=Colletotrichum musicola TaxID=2175873 RepID=A0A8H6JD37_9PEZI|nr:hypothetical protein CMUS01_13366 [Colletotrichum musicola]